MSEEPCGARVSTTAFSAALDETRRLRMALNVLWDGLPDELSGPGTVMDGLSQIHQYLCRSEDDALQQYGVPDFYLVIRPVSPAALPATEQLSQIAAAVRALAELDMLVGHDDADSRDPDCLGEA